MPMTDLWNGFLLEEIVVDLSEIEGLWIGEVDIGMMWSSPHFIRNLDKVHIGEKIRADMLTKNKVAIHCREICHRAIRADDGIEL